MINLARDGLTHDEVVKILHAPNRKEWYEVLLLDKDENEKGILEKVKSLSIEYKSLRTIKRTANITIAEGKQAINYLSDRIKPVFYIESQGKRVSFPLGIFLLNSPERADSGSEITREISCYSKLQILLDDSFSERYFIPAGTNYVGAISAIIASTGEENINIEPTDKVLTVDKEFDISKSKLEIVNELLEEINYYSLRTDENGYFVSYPYVEPDSKEITYQYIDNELSVTYYGMKETLDLFEVKNCFLAYTNNPEKESLISIYKNESEFSEISTVNLGREKWDKREVQDIADQEALDNYVKRIAIEASNVYGHVEFKTAIMPFHSDLDNLYLRYTPLGIDGNFQEIGWSINFADNTMSHDVRKLVRL